MFNKNLAREAHKMAKEIKGKYPEVNYKFQFGLNVKYLLSKVEGVEKVMVELVGTPKQVKYASDIRNEIIRIFDTAFKLSCEWGWKTESGKEKAKIRMDEKEQEILNITSAKTIIEKYKHLLSYGMGDVEKYEFFKIELKGSKLFGKAIKQIAVDPLGMKLYQK